jgi:hypothetical protein
LGSVEGSAVKESGARNSSFLPGYQRLDGGIPVFHPPGLEVRASEVRDLLEVGTIALSEILEIEPPRLETLLVADDDWERAPRENERPYPSGLPYFTRASRPPLVVLPETLSPVFQPRTSATEALIVWHELAHAFLMREPKPRAPAWLRELVPQTSSAAVARRARLPLDEHLGAIDPSSGFTLRDSWGRANAARQMDFQNLLLALGAAALEEFGEGFLRTLAHALWSEKDAVDEERAEELLATSLGPGGRRWLGSRPEFREA